MAESPSIKYLLPSAIAPGQTTEITFFGNNLDSVTGLWMSFDGKAERVGCTNDRAVFKITAPGNCLTGLGALRLRATNGISDLHFIMFDALRSIVASATNQSTTNAQLLALPIAVDGACREKASEFFKFRARKGQRLTFEVVAQRLGSALDPLVRLLDAKGRELVFCEDTPGAGVDCRFDYKFAATGEYRLELRDSRYDGGSQYRYRLRMGDFPLERTPLPFLAKSELSESGSDNPQIEEVEPNDSKPQNVSLPVSIHGRFQKAKDRDCFLFEAKKGERLIIRSKTRSLGSPCDLYLRLQTPDGKKLAESPLLGAEESSLTNTFKEGGIYQLLVEEAAQLGGPEYFYHLDLEPYQPGFALSLETEKLQAPSGGSAEIKIAQERQGYDGPITLALEGLAEGFLLTTNVLTSKTNATAVTMKLPSELEPGQMVNFKITGHAKIGGKDVSVTASTRPALRKLFPHLPWPPPELDGWIALGVTER